MYAASWFGIGPMLIMLVLGGAGVPVGIPPGPEDPMMAKVAPRECLFYTSWAGMAKPDPASGNHTERLLAEPEIQQLFAAVKRQIQAAMTKATDRPGPQTERMAMVQQGLVWGEMLLCRPAAIFVSSVKVNAQGGPPDIRAGAVFAVGDDVTKLKTTLEMYQKLLPPQSVKPVEIDGATWQRIQVDPKAPSVTWGVKGPYLIVGIGEGSVEGILQRAKGPAPAWLAELRSQLTVDRVATITYVNIQSIVKEFAPLGGARAIAAIDAAGLTGVTSLSSVTGLDEAGYVSRTLIGLNGAPTGIFSFATAKPLSAEDLKAIPADATLAMAAKLDADALLETILTFITTVEPRAERDITQGFEGMRRELGIDLRADVLAPLGDTWRIYNSPSEGGLVFTGLTAVVEVDNMARLAATNQQLIILAQTMMGPRDSPRTPRIEQFEFAGREVYYFDARDDDFPLAPAWCLTDKQLIVAPFPQNIKAYLSRSATVKSLASVPEVAAVMKSPDRPLLLCYHDTPKLFELIYPIVPFFAQALCSQMQRQGIDVTVDILPSAPAIGKHLRPGVTTLRRTKAGIEFTSHQTLPGGSIGATAPAAVALLLPAVHSARGAARRMQSMNNMKQIAIAMFNYESAHGSYPPAYSTDKKGKPLLSWRVQMLPYIEDANLYEEFHLDEPWDSEHNKKLIAKMPSTYRSPKSRAAPGYTNYLTVRGKDTAFPGSEKIRLADITDGTSNTIMVVEASDAKAVPWTKPDDFEYDKRNPSAGLVGLRRGGFLAGMCDGAVHFIPSWVDARVLAAYFTRRGAEVVPRPGELRSGKARPMVVDAPRADVPPLPEQAKTLEELVEKELEQRKRRKEAPQR